MLLLSTYGTTGDVLPFLALGRALQRHGYDVLLATLPFYRPMVERAGLPFHPFPAGDGTTVVDSTVMKAIMQAMIDEPDARLHAKVFYERALLPYLAPLYHEHVRLCGKSDAVISSYVQLAASLACKRTNTPWITVTLFHAGRSRSPLVTLPPLKMFGPLGRRLSGAVFRATVKHVSRRCYDLSEPVCATLGHTPPRDVFAPSPLLDLVAVSPSIAPRQPDWPQASTPIGYLWHHPDTDWRPDDALDQFMRTHRPLVITLGSMTTRDPEAMTREFIAAAGAAGNLPAVIQSGWAGLASIDPPPNVRMVGEIPHDWLFPRASCVVHHGGAGTTGSCFRAGVPQVVIPHLGDQPYWGLLVEELRVGRGLQRSRLRRLPAVLRDVLTSPRYAEQAKHIAQHMANDRAEDTAVELIGGVLGKVTSDK